MSMKIYREGEYSVVHVHALLRRYRQAQPTFVWRQSHGLHIPNPRGNDPHLWKNVMTVSPETVALAAIGGNWQALEMVDHLVCQPEPEYLCTRCRTLRPVSEFSHDPRTPRRGFTRSWCKMCERADRHERYVRSVQAKALR